MKPKSESDLEEMAGAAQALREQGINPAIHTADGTAESIRYLLPIFTDHERIEYLFALIYDIQTMLTAEAARQRRAHQAAAPAPSSKPN